MYAWEIRNTSDLEICVEELRAEMAEWDARLEAAGVEDATAWEHFPEMEEVMYALGEFEVELAERRDFEARYPREQYEADRARLIAEGEDPRCIMSYHECFAHDRWERELEREREIEEAYDEYYKQMLEDLAEDERDRAISKEVAEIEELLEFVEVIEENSRAEIQAFGFIALLDDLEELEDFALVDGYINALEDLFAVGKVGGAEIYEYNELMDEFDEMMTREYRV